MRALVEVTARGWRPKQEALAWVREIRDLCTKPARPSFTSNGVDGRRSQVAGVSMAASGPSTLA